MWKLLRAIFLGERSHEEIEEVLSAAEVRMVGGGFHADGQLL